METNLDKPVEVLSFCRGDNLAKVATDGGRHVSLEFERYMVATDVGRHVSLELELVKEHASLSQAIAYLEAKGYDIDIDNFKTI